MRSLRKCPGSALHRATGTEEEIHMQPNSQPQIYATCGELQTRHVRSRCGLSGERARLIAALHFGEVGR